MAISQYSESQHHRDNLTRDYQRLAEDTALPTDIEPRLFTTVKTFALLEVPDYLEQARRQSQEVQVEVSNTLAKMKIYSHLAASTLERRGILRRLGLSEPDGSCNESIFVDAPYTIARRLVKMEKAP